MFSCSARTRTGGRCRRAPIRGRRRCRLHGGRSTGWRGPRGAHWLAAITAGRKRWLARRHAAGLKATGGRPKRTEKVAAMVKEAVVVADRLLERLPVPSDE